MAYIEIEGIDGDSRIIENVKVYLHGAELLPSGLHTVITIRTPGGAQTDLMLDLSELAHLALYTSEMISLLRGDIGLLRDFDVSITEEQIPREWAGLFVTR
jgi:hypothetical protein